MYFDSTKNYLGNKYLVTSTSTSTSTWGASTSTSTLVASTITAQVRAPSTSHSTNTHQIYTPTEESKSLKQKAKEIHKYTTYVCTVCFSTAFVLCYIKLHVRSIMRFCVTLYLRRLLQRTMVITMRAISSSSPTPPATPPIITIV